jgi:hypothetical protein
MENFSFSQLDVLNLDQQKQYLHNVLIPLDNGDHVIKKNEKYEIISNDLLKQVYINRFDDKLAKWYIKENKSIKQVVCELNEPKFYDNKFNLCPQIKASYQPYEEFAVETKEGVDLFLKYIFEVLASSSQENYIYIQKWLSNALKGNKNDSCIYLKGPQGIGKSTISDFLKLFVVGEDLFLETGSKPFKSTFNFVTFGRLFIQISELESTSTSDWYSLSSKLKRIITSTTETYEEKNQKQFQAKNLANYMIDSNNDTIKDDEGRRFYIADVSTKYRENHSYFGTLRAKCFNDEVGKAFYSYMLEYDTNGFIPQKFPITNSKLASFTKRINPIYEFIKNFYILDKKDMNMLATELFEKFWNTHDKKKFPRADLKKALEEVGIVYSKINSGNSCYKYSYSQLKEIGDKFHWLDELDNETINNIVEPVETNYFNELNIEHNKLKELLAEKDKLLAEKEKLIAEKDKEIELLLQSKAIPQIERTEKTMPKKKIIIKENSIPIIETASTKEMVEVSNEDDIFMSLLQNS